MSQENIESGTVHRDNVPPLPRVSVSHSTLNCSSAFLYVEATSQIRMAAALSKISRILREETVRGPMHALPPYVIVLTTNRSLSNCVLSVFRGKLYPTGLDAAIEQADKLLATPGTYVMSPAVSSCVGGSLPTAESSFDMSRASDEQRIMYYVTLFKVGVVQIYVL